MTIREMIYIWEHHMSEQDRQKYSSMVILLEAKFKVKYDEKERVKTIITLYNRDHNIIDRKKRREIT